MSSTPSPSFTGFSWTATVRAAPVGPVVRDERAEVEPGEQVAVADEEGLVEALDAGEGARGARGLHVAHEAVAREVAQLGVALHVGHDELGEVVDGQGDLGDAVADERADEDLQHGAVADGDERLGERHGERGEAAATTAREDHGLHAVGV
jgi:hypothetical protein